jgi:hypothetical protein
MFSETISTEYIVTQNGTSDGTQIKYFKDRYWYKEDNRGNEGLAEYLASRLLAFSSLNPNEYVIYEQGTINGKNGCRSKNFLHSCEELITLYRLYYTEYGKDLSTVISQMENMEERIEYVLDFVMKSTKLNLEKYFSKVFTLDMIVLNEDRHLNNLAVIFDGNKFREAPIFDQGISLLTANQSVNWHFSIEENTRRVIARPFSGSHEKMQSYFGKGFDLDIKAALKWLEKEPQSKEKEILCYQLKRYEKYFNQN